MGFLDRVKNLFTEPEDSEDEIQIEQIKKEGSKISVDSKPAVPRKEVKEEIIEEVIEEVEEIPEVDEPEEIVEEIVEEEPPVVEVEKPKLTREQIKTPVFFTEEEFEDLEPERPKREIEKKKVVSEPRPLPKKEEKRPYSGSYTSTSILTKEKPTFKPTPIISPIYGILDKNYTKDDIVEKKDKIENKAQETVVSDKFDEVRNKAYGMNYEKEKSIYDTQTITPKTTKNRIEEEIDLFDELENDKLDFTEEVNISNTTELAKTVTEQEKNIRELEEVTMDLTKELDNLLLKRESYNQNKSTSSNDDELLTENEVFNFIDSIYEEGKE